MFKITHVVSLTLATLISPVAMAQTAATPPAATPPAAPAPQSAGAGSDAPAAPVAAAPVATPVVDSTTASSPPPACELHIWPAARVAAVTQGMGAGFGLIGALIDSSAHADQNKRDQAFITAALDAKAQAKVLRELDLPTLLHLPPSAVIIHDQGMDIKTDDTRRLSDSSTKCYYEFVVRSLSYFKNAVYSGQMRTFLALRGFDGASIKTDFTDSKHETLEVKLPKEGEDTGPATDALISAFRLDVTFFANKFAKKKA
jgi:hypothetical protein